MSKIVDDEPAIKTHPASQAYRDGWERTFGDERPTPQCPGCSKCCGTGCVIDPDVDPSTVVTEGDLLKDCPGERGCGVCGELVGCVCDDHDPACARLCTEGADCDCGAVWRR